jgi:hypothetical protein
MLDRLALVAVLEQPVRVLRHLEVVLHRQGLVEFLGAQRLRKLILIVVLLR